MATCTLPATLLTSNQPANRHPSPFLTSRNDPGLLSTHWGASFLIESEAQPRSPYALNRSSHVWQQGCVGDSAPKQDGHFSFLGMGALLAVACVGVLILFPNLSNRCLITCCSM